MNVPSTISTNRSRIRWVDAAKGFGIILVVVGHAMRSLVTANIVAMTPAVAFLDRWIYSFHMPLFFFLSGLFLQRSAEKPVAEFTRDKIATIAYPYFVWSLLTLLIKSPLGDIVNQPRTLLETPQILYHPVEQFWFLYVLFLLSVGAGLLLKSGINFWGLLVLGVLLYPGILPLPWSGWIPFEELRSDAIYFTLGIALGAKGFSNSLTTVRNRSLICIVAIGLLASVLCASFAQPAGRLLEFCAATSGVAVFIALAALSTHVRAGAAVSFLGQYSLEIFVAHSIAAGAVRIALQQLWQETAWFPYVMLCVAVGLYAPVLLAMAFRSAGVNWAFTSPKVAKSRNSSRNEIVRSENNVGANLR